MPRHEMHNDPLVICDLDNTLYDWYSYFVPSIYALIASASQILDCDEQRIIDDLKIVHRKYQDSEHPYALLETAIVTSKFPRESARQLVDKLDPAFHAFNASRKANLSLFEGVIDTLALLKESGHTIVAHTESKTFGAVDRLHRLGLEKFLSRIYCREEATTAHPRAEAGSAWLKDFRWDKIVRLPTHELKPNPKILRQICESEGVTPSAALYIGDSLAKDIWMAKQVGCYAVWAEYGAQPDPDVYDKLVRISHWTDEDVARERAIRKQAASVKADYVCSRSFREILPALQIFGRPQRVAG